MKKFYLFSVMVLFSVALYAQDAAGIVNASRNRIKADTIMTQSRMVITAKKGSTSEMLINQYSKDTADGKNRIVIEFGEPAGVRGTRFLTLENKTNADDRWIYLPAAGKLRRIVASEGSGSFMGTDLSYDDISSADRDVAKDTHKLLKEEKLNGTDCYVIESNPKDTSYQYSKMISWIGKNNSVSYKLELYDKKNTLQKTFETIELKDVQGRLSPWVTKMTTHSAGSFTTIYIKQLAYDKEIPEGVFTTAYIETGRP
ncbi:MAG: outer membrane lipoprotein-sorting protein [Termitinemataceae bacterium]|nr:MAG: outer membrane lipoprotein-sorting protein [Termitinemataceae bacterium]